MAVGETETGLAFARPALRRRRRVDDDVARVVALAVTERAERVVLGLPLNMDGSEGPQASRARSFGERLAAAGLSVDYHDERLTSWQARQETGAGTHRDERWSGALDSAAARILLQEYLDARRVQRAESREV